MGQTGIYGADRAMGKLWGSYEADRATGQAGLWGRQGYGEAMGQL